MRSRVVPLSYLSLLLLWVPCWSGFHPGDLLEKCETKGKRYVLSGSALIVTTSHSVLGPVGCTSCKKTGVFSEEMTVPYYIFQDAGLNVTIATIEGGAVPVDPKMKVFSSYDARFYADPKATAAIINTTSVDELNLTEYDVVWLAGGWGAAWDLAGSEALIKGTSERWANKQLQGSVCHGALGFVNATKPDGSPLVTGLNMTAVTDKQIEQLGIASKTPMHPEDELRRRGAHFMAKHGVTDLVESLTVVDGALVTGQNQNSGCETAQRLLDQMAERV